MPRIKWVEEADAKGETARVFELARSGAASGVKREYVPHILMKLRHRPDFLSPIMDASRVHFSDGALTRAQHEMIASYVAALNKCHY